MKNFEFKLSRILNAFLILWIAIWFYFILFNWDIFIVKLNVNLGFGIIKCLPFLSFFILGLAIILALKYIINYFNKLNQEIDNEKDTKINLLQKDIEILKLKEMLFKVQTKEYNQTATNINSMQEKLDQIVKQFEEEKDEQEKTIKKKKENNEDIS